MEDTLSRSIVNPSRPTPTSVLLAGSPLSRSPASHRSRSPDFITREEFSQHTAILAQILAQLAALTSAAAEKQQQLQASPAILSTAAQQITSGIAPAEATLRTTVQLPPPPPPSTPSPTSTVPLTPSSPPAENSDVSVGTLLRFAEEGRRGSGQYRPPPQRPPATPSAAIYRPPSSRRGSLLSPIIPSILFTKAVLALVDKRERVFGFFPFDPGGLPVCLSLC